MCAALIGALELLLPPSVCRPAQQLAEAVASWASADPLLAKLLPCGR